MCRFVSLLLLGSALGCGACASVDPGPDYERARREIQATTGATEIHDPRAPALTVEEIDAVLADGLDLAEATRLALLNNRRLQAGFLSLGVARADFVQAGLLENPNLSLAFLFPDAGGRARWTADLVGNVAEIWRLPARQALAQAGLEQRVLELSRFAGELVADTRRAYLETVAAGEGTSLAREDHAVARRALDCVRRQAEHGAATDTDVLLAESRALAAELAVGHAEREEADSLRRLAVLLSLERDLVATALTDSIPGSREPETGREELVVQSLSARADLRASARAVAAAEQRLESERRRRFGLDAGVSAEGPEGGGASELLVGPGANLELPLFDQHQARVARAELELAALRKEHEARLVEVRQEVRAAMDRARFTARAASFARSDLLPQALRSAALAERAYELGDTTILTLLQAQRDVLGARRAELDARLDAAVARIDVDRAAGAPLGDAAAQASDP